MPAQPSLTSSNTLSRNYAIASGGPVFKTVVVTTADGYEQRNVGVWDPLEIYDVTYDTRTPADVAALRTFFSDRKGNYQSFLWQSPYASSAVESVFLNPEFNCDFDPAGVSTVTFQIAVLLPSSLPELPDTFPADSGETLDLGLGEDARSDDRRDFTVSIFGDQQAVFRRHFVRDLRKRWTIRFNLLNETDFAYLRDFFLARKGRAQGFSFVPPEGGSAVFCRFDSDEWKPRYEHGEGEPYVMGEIDIVEILSVEPPTQTEYWEQDVTTICKLWAITSPILNSTIRLTSATRDVIRNDETYQSGALEMSVLQLQRGLASDNAEASASFQDAMTFDDLRAGLWNGSDVEIMDIDFLHPDDTPARRNVGTIGQISLKEDSFSVEFRGLTQKLAEPIGDVSSTICRAQLGDFRCQKSLTSFTHTGTVTAVTSREVCTVDVVQATDYFRKGKIVFTSGENDGAEIEILKNTAGALTLALPAPRDIEVGDEVTLVAGCDGQIETCKTKFDNVINFQGEPDLPGLRVFEFPR